MRRALLALILGPPVLSRRPTVGDTLAAAVLGDHAGLSARDSASP